MSTDRFVTIDEAEVLYSPSSHTPLMTTDLVGWMMYAVGWIKSHCNNRRSQEGLLKAVVALAASAQVGSRLGNGAQYASVSLSQLEKMLGITRKSAIRYLNNLTLTGEFEYLRQKGVEPLLRRLERGKSRRQASCYEYIWPGSSGSRSAESHTSGEKPGLSPLVQFKSTGGETGPTGVETGLMDGENPDVGTPTASTDKTISAEAENAQYRAFLGMFDKAPGAKAGETREEYERLRKQGWSHGELIDAVKRQVDESASRGRTPYLYPYAFLASNQLSRWLFHVRDTAPKKTGVYRDGLGNWCHICGAGYEEPIGPPSMPEEVALQIHDELNAKEN